MKSASEIVQMRKAFNQREGWTPVEDNLPESIFTESPTEASVLTKDRLHELIFCYNTNRGYSPEGWLSENQMRMILDLNHHQTGD